MKKKFGTAGLIGIIGILCFSLVVGGCAPNCVNFIAGRVDVYGNSLMLEDVLTGSNLSTTGDSVLLTRRNVFGKCEWELVPIGATPGVLQQMCQGFFGDVVGAAVLGGFVAIGAKMIAGSIDTAGKGLTGSIDKVGKNIKIPNTMKLDTSNLKLPTDLKLDLKGLKLPTGNIILPNGLGNIKF